MAITYNVLSQQEMDKIEEQRFAIPPEGIWDALVESAKEKISKSGNPMFELHLTIYGDAGTQYAQPDYLIPGNKNVYYKFKHFIESIGNLDLLNGCTDAREFVQQQVKVIIQHKKETYEDKYGIRKEALRASVSDYVPKGNIIKNETSLNDEIPF